MQMNSQKRESTEITLLSLLLARKRPCTLTQLTKDYYEMEGGHIPWRELGYHSLLNLLQSMPKSVFIDHRDNTILVSGIASDKSKHVSKLVAGQKEQKHVVGRRLHKPSHYYPHTGHQRIHIPAELLAMIISYVNENPDGVNKDYILKEVQSHMPYTHISMSDMEEQLQKLSHQIYLSRNRIFPAQSKLNNAYSSAAIVTASGNEDSDGMIDDDGDEDDFQFVPSGYTPDPSQAKANAKNKSTSNFIKETVSKCQDQVPQAKAANHTSRIETDQMNSCNSHNYTYDDADQSKMELNNNLDNENYFDGKNVDILINERVKFRLEKLIQNHPEGIWCADLPEKYLEEYKVSLNYTELGFNSVREFASQLPETFHCVQPYDTGDFMLYYAKRDIPSSKSKEKQKLTLAEMHNIYMKDEEDALPLSLTLDTCKRLIPDGIVTIGECVGQLNVEDLLNIERPYIEVVVVEVFSPSFFWIQLRKKQKAFTQFMDDLHHFYSRKQEDYVIPPVVLEKGLNCACIYNEVWHRGIIMTVNPDLQVTVMFYDYGTLKTYPPDAVFYLHRMFSSIPAQAIPCGLINTRPYKGTKWSRSVTHHFAVRTSQIPLIATIASVNSEDNSMMVTLTDTLGEEDVHINDWLVEQKLAEHGKMGDKVDMSNLLLYVEENLIYSPEQCYEEEIDEDKSSNKNSEEEAVNMPLVSPQSTLNDNKSFTFPPDISLCDKLQKLPVIREETVQDQIIKNIAMAVASPLTQTNTNPFLYDETTSNQAANELTQERFIQLWNENVKLQMQITATFHLLFNRAMKYPDNNTGDNLIKNEQVLDMMRNTILHLNEDTPASSNLTTTNNSSTYPATIPPIANSYNDAKTAAMNYDFMNTGYPTGSSTFTGANQQQLLCNASNYKNNLNCSNSVDFFQTSGIQNSARNLAPMYPNSVVPADNNVGAANQFLVDERAPAKENFTSRFEGFNTQLNIGLDGGHNFPNNVSTDFPTPSNNSINDTNLVKDTNPFRLMLAGKLRLSDSDEENSLKPNNLVSASHRNAESVTEHNSINFEKTNTNTNHPKQDVFDNLCNEKSFDYYQYFLTNSLSNVNSNNLPVVSTQSQPTNRKWSLDDVTSNMSRIIINNPSTVHNINLATEVGKHTEKDNGHVLNSNTYNYDTFARAPYSEISPREYGEKQKQEENLVLKTCILPPRKPFAAHYSESIQKANEQRSYYTNDASTFNQPSFAHRNILTTTDRIPNCPAVKENSITSSWSPLNSFIPPVSIDHINTDEGYLTRPSTSHTSYRSSPLTQVNNEVEHGQQSPAINPNVYWATQNRMWMKSIERPTIIQPENWTKLNCLLKKNDNVKLGYNGSQQENSSENICIRSAAEPQVNDLYSQESKLQNIWKSPAPEEPAFIDNKSTIQSGSSQTKTIFVQVIELPKRMIHVFHHEGEGWLLMDEFVQAFTVFGQVPYLLEFLNRINVQVPITEIDRTQYVVEMFKLNGIMLEATQNIIYGTNNLQLMPLRSTLKLLRKMKIISTKDIDDAVKREFTNQVMREIWFIINAYGQLKHRIENEG